MVKGKVDLYWQESSYVKNIILNYKVTLHFLRLYLYFTNQSVYILQIRILIFLRIHHLFYFHLKIRINNSLFISFSFQNKN